MRIDMRASQMLPTFDYTITVLNKMRAQDSTTKQDIWFKTVIHNCAWSSEIVRNVMGNRVDVGASYIVRVPKDDRYKPYAEWIKDNIGFTFGADDYVIKGEIEEDIITPQNILKVVQKYRPDAFQVRVFKDNTGTIELGEHYRIEGV